MMKAEELRALIVREFPLDATCWSQATDEPRDMSRWARKALGLGDEHAADFDLAQTPADWNRTGATSVTGFYQCMTYDQQSAYVKLLREAFPTIFKDVPMSQSTEISVTIGQVTVGYHYYSRQLADQLNVVELHKPMYITGVTARALLDAGEILPEDLLNFARKTLVRYDAEIRQGDPDGEDQERTDRMLKDAVCVTVIRRD